jgi:PGF-CTERM protein
LQVLDRDLSRRSFTRLSAATVGALLAGSTRTRAETLTDRYAFLLDHVEADTPIPTLARFADQSGLDALADLDVEARSRPGQPAAYARLTPAQAETLADAGTTDLLEYAPGANPFWKLDADGERVFPDPADSVDFIAFEEALAGLDRLASAHPDRLRVETIGRGHGHENLVTDTRERRPVWLAELTDDVTAAGDRETVVFDVSIHGDERAGVEAGLRFIEDVLTGERPGVAAALSDLRLVFVCPNPDGWVVREPVYEDPVDPPDFRRYNGADRDLNRQQPTAGWIPPDRLPGEPRGANLTDDVPGAVDDDVPEAVTAGVPETLALVQRLRSYEHVEYLLDLHGMYGKTEAVLAIETGGGTPADRADADLLTRSIETRLQEAVGPLADWSGVFERALGDIGEQTGETEACEFDLLCQSPVQLFGSGTALDTIGYTVSGGLDGWAGLPEQVGGLGATSLTLEVVFSNSLASGMERRFMPDIVAFQVAAYGAVCEAAVEHARDETGVAVETGGRSTAYLDSETLTRRATDLPHVADSGVPTGGGSAGATTLAAGAPGAGGTASTLAVDSQQFDAGPVTATVEVPADTHTLTVEVRPDGNRPVEATLRDGEGTVRHASGPTDGDPFGPRRLTSLDPAAGEWQVDATVRGEAVPVEVRVTRLVADGPPDPMDTLGYGQRDYEVTPLAALDALGSAADAPVEAVTADALAPGSLVVDGDPAYDNLVVSHTHGVDETALAGLAAYVEAGGNLVLTDSGLDLVGDLDVAGLETVESGDIDREELPAASYTGIDRSHPLAADRRTFPEESSTEIREPWTHPPMGYASDEVPMHTVAEEPLQEAGATVASAVDGRVRLATVETGRTRVGVHLLGSLLPPANQEQLHPFGLLDHSLTRFGYLLLCNALGYRLSLSRNGQVTATLGSVLDVDDGDGGDGGDGDGSDGDDGDGDDSDGSGDGDGGNGSDGEGDDGGSDDGNSDGDGSSDDGDGSGDGDGDGGDGGGDGDDGGEDGSGGGDAADDNTTDGDGSADDGGPGFGIPAGVAGLGGLGYLLSRRGSDDESE